MALAKQVKNIYIRGTNFTGGNVSSTVYNIQVQNFTIDPQDVYWNNNPTDEALSGYLRSNFRGFRAVYTFNFDVSVEPMTIRSLLNDIYVDFVTNGVASIEISMDSGSNYVDVVPESLRYLIEYTQTIGKFTPSFKFMGQDILTSIPSYLESP